MEKVSKLTQWCSGAIFIFMGIRFIWNALNSNKSIISSATVSVLLFILAYGLLNNYRWALRSSAFIFLMAAIILPVGIFNPFTAGDYMAAGKQPPDVKHTLLWLIPVEIILLSLVFIIDPKRNRIDSAAQKNNPLESTKVH
ncbi:MAG: hypothetical protein HY265_08125 [Deltaproteobacteria bacterium]|nr:hypothetical protein [Deltaproteobacteria bacterium]